MNDKDGRNPYQPPEYTNGNVAIKGTGRHARRIVILTTFIAVCIVNVGGQLVALASGYAGPSAGLLLSLAGWTGYVLSFPCAVAMEMADSPGMQRLALLSVSAAETIILYYGVRYGRRWIQRWRV